MNIFVKQEDVIQIGAHCVHFIIDFFVYRYESQLVEQRLLTFKEQVRSPPVLSWDSCCALDIIVCPICTFSFAHCIVCSSIYDF